MLHLYAALAEKERALSSARTKAALAAKKAAGVQLGDPRSAEAAVGAPAAHRASVDRFAANILPIIGSIRASGILSYLGIVDALNSRGIHLSRWRVARDDGAKFAQQVALSCGAPGWLKPVHADIRV
jgi:DNA invertase Pin-like site-specific DNA recombinase